MGSKQFCPGSKPPSLSCDASGTIDNGTIGDCTSTLNNGATCNPVCNNGYTLSGNRKCDNGTLSDTANCNQSITGKEVYFYSILNTDPKNQYPYTNTDAQQIVGTMNDTVLATDKQIMDEHNLTDGLDSCNLGWCVTKKKGNLIIMNPYKTARADPNSGCTNVPNDPYNAANGEPYSNFLNKAGLWLYGVKPNFLDCNIRPQSGTPDLTPCVGKYNLTKNSKYSH